LANEETEHFLREYAVVPTIGSYEAAQAWSLLADGVLPAFLKVDVGLERIGVYAELAADFVRATAKLPNMRIEGIYTHLHGGDAPGYLQWQLDRFDGLLDDLDRAGLEVPTRLAESSVTLGRTSRPRLNAVDPGHLLYGFVPSGRESAPEGTRPAFAALKTRLLEVKAVHRPGFREAAPIPLREGMQLGVIPLGRSDGLRSLHCGSVLVHGRRVPIIGRLSLEHARVDLTDVADCKPGDEVVVIGRQGAEEITPDEVAALHGLDGVGLALEVRPSVSRVYLRD
jgi:alanine racemase